MKGSITTTIPLLALAGALVGCGDRGAMTAPAPAGVAAASTALVVDQPYQWDVTCVGDEAAYVGLHWFIAGVHLDSYSQYVVCPSKGKLTGSGVRPAGADAFMIAVGTGGIPVSHEDQTWTVDPTAPFSAQLNYNFQDVYYVCDFFCKKANRKVSGQVKVSS